MVVKRVERHVVKSTKELVTLAVNSKRLYNCATFIMRQNFIFNKKVISYCKMDKLLRRDYEEVYRALPSNTAQQILRLVEKDWKSFLRAIKSYKKNPKKFTGRPKLPNYKDKEKGLHIAIFTRDQCKIKNNEIKFPVKANLPNLKIKCESLQQVRIVPKFGHFVIEVVYNKEISTKETNKSNVLGIDLGLNNLATLVSNQPDVSPMLINGRPLKSINQYFNKLKAELMSFVKGKGASRRIGIVSKKRGQKIDDYLHKASRKIIDYAVETNTGLIVVGDNSHWKQKINLGKKNNQNFVSIPFDRLKQMITYKAEEQAIEVVFTEESYTSKASHLDRDCLPKFKEGEKHFNFSGKRVKRGLYRWSKGLINADLNGSLGIIKKVVPETLENLIEIRNRGRGFRPFKVHQF